jgi:hypothetical protein
MKYSKKEIKEAKSIACWHEQNFYNEIKTQKPYNMNLKKALSISEEFYSKESGRDQYSF